MTSRPSWPSSQKAARDGAPARPDANLELDLGLDSMERVELLTALEQRFGAECQRRTPSASSPCGSSSRPSGNTRG